MTDSCLSTLLNTLEAYEESDDETERCLIMFSFTWYFWFIPFILVHTMAAASDIVQNLLITVITMGNMFTLLVLVVPG